MSRSSTTSIKSRRWFLKKGLWLPFAPAILHGADWGGFKEAFGPIMRTMAAGGGGQAAAYIGGDNINSSTGAMITNDGTDVVPATMAWNLSFACPGTGTRVLDEMGVYSDANSNNDYRIAIYTAAGAFVAQTDKLSFIPSGVKWFTSSSFLNQAKAPLSPVNLTGGSNYIMAISATGTDTIYYKTVTGGAYNVTDAATNGYPATLPSATTTNEDFGVRGHVAAT